MRSSYGDLSASVVVQCIVHGCEFKLLNFIPPISTLNFDETAGAMTNDILGHAHSHASHTRFSIVLNNSIRGELKVFNGVIELLGPIDGNGHEGGLFRRPEAEG